MADALSTARTTRYLEIGRHVLTSAPRVFREQFGNHLAMVVADPNTLAAAAQVLMQAFRSAKQPLTEPFIFRAPNFHAEQGRVVELEAALQRHNAIPVAVGAGTINDVTKLAAHRTGRPYMCVATAASMDGYTAFGASITLEGSKQTFPCPAPVAVIADLDVIRAAPRVMTASGYADLLAKTTAGADWLLADALGEEPLHERAWSIVQGSLREAVAAPAAVRAGELGAIQRLTEGLMLGGLAMQAAESSRPASGSEHQFSHLWDMQRHTHNGETPSHGFKVGIGTMAVTALYEWLLAKPLEQLNPEMCAANWPDEAAWLKRARELFGDGDLGRVATREIAAKYASASQVRAQLKQLRKIWPALKERLREQLPDSESARENLRLAGAATDPEQIGISRERLRDSFWQAFFMRRRFTVLDLAARAGLFNNCVEEIFGSGGKWPIKT